jgi:acetyltransferase-like isoleucine patch superfamily enzyme
MKTWLNKCLAKIVNRLLLLHEKHRLNIIYKNPNITGTEGLRIEEYFTANLPAGNFSIKFGPYVHIKKHCHILLFDGAELTIDTNVFINNYCSINCLEKIHIGENTMFGEGVKIYDHNHAHSYINGKLTIEKANFNTAPIIIGANCWIGSNVTILKGVTIGDNAIIGANNLIYQSIPANTIVKAKSEYTIVPQP